MRAQRPSLHDYKNNHFYQDIHYQCSCKVCIGVATIDCTQHPHMNTRHNESMTTFHFDILEHIPIISKSHMSWVYEWYPCWLDVHSSFDCGWMSEVGVHVGDKSSINHNVNGLLGKLRVNSLDCQIDCIVCKKTIETYHTVTWLVIFEFSLHTHEEE
jgi:hypothetical protein